MWFNIPCLIARVLIRCRNIKYHIGALFSHHNFGVHTPRNRWGVQYFEEVLNQAKQLYIVLIFT